MKDAFERPYIIGYQRCQYVDRFEARQGILKKGMIQKDGTAYKTLAQHVSEANTQA